MKKFLAIFLVLTLLFSFAACNKDENPNADNDGNATTENQVGEQVTKTEEDVTHKKPNKEEKTTAEPFENPNLTQPEALFKIIDVNNYELQSRNPKTLSSGVTIVSERYEAKNKVASNITDSVMVGDAEIILNGTTVRDFISKGWTITGKYDANSAIEAGKETNIFLENDKKEVVKLVIKNTTANSVAVADCTITGVSVAKTITQNTWVDFTIGGKTDTSKSGYEDYIKAFGNPVSVNVIEYYQGKDFTHCKTTLNFEKTVGNNTWTISVLFEDVNGKLTTEVCTVEVK